MDLSHITATVDEDFSHVFDQLAELVAIPSIHASDLEAVAQSAEWTHKAFTAVGMPVDTIDTVDGSAAIIGRYPAAPGKPTVLLYSHHDVVNAGTLADWDTDPWTLTAKEDGRWYGRGAADCKGHVVLHLAALRALRTLVGTDDHPFGGMGITVICEGSEENGGAGLNDLVTRDPSLAAADSIIIADTGNTTLGEPTLTMSLRGSASVTVELTTLATPVHSGSFGGSAPDAVFALIHLLSTLRDRDGNLTIDGVPADQEWTGAQWGAEEFRRDSGMLPGTTLLGSGSPADMVWARPTLTVTGFDHAPVAEAVNAVPARAAAHLNVRVPASMDPLEVQDLLVAHLERHVPWGAHLHITRDEIGQPFAATPDSPTHQAFARALSVAFDKPTSYAGTGGSIPLTADLQQACPTADIVLFGVEEPQCVIHSPNESVSAAELRACLLAEVLFLLDRGGHIDLT